MLPSTKAPETFVFPLLPPGLTTVVPLELLPGAAVLVEPVPGLTEELPPGAVLTAVVAATLLPPGLAVVLLPGTVAAVPPGTVAAVPPGPELV